MSVSLSYPGVYVEELPSGVHAITGVPTSIAAFVGRALRGPLNDPTTVSSYADFGRQFGGLALGYPMSYAVRDFFANGGGQAIVVRIWSAGPTSSLSSASSSSLGGASSASASSASAFALPLQPDGIARTNLTDPDTIGLALQAQSPGAWGNKVSAQVVLPNPAIDATVATNLGYSDPSQLFNLLVNDTGTGTSETIRNVSVFSGTRRVDQVLAMESQLVAVPIDTTTLKPVLPTTTPGASSAIFLSGGGDGDIITDPGDYVPTDGSNNGIYALETAGIFNLLAIPPDSATPDSVLWTSTGALYSDVYPQAMAYCKKKRAVLIVDPPYDWLTVTDAAGGPAKLGLTADGDYGALYFPMLVEPDPLRQGQLDDYPPSGAVCGVIASTDNARGVWKAPAGIDAAFVGVQALAYSSPTATAERSIRSASTACATFRSSARSAGAREPVAAPTCCPTNTSIFPCADWRSISRRASYRGTQVGRFRAQRRAAVGADPPERRRVHAGPVPQGRLPGDDAEARPTS